MKKITIILLVAVLLLVNVSAALAAGGPPPNKGKSPFALVGTITAISGSTVTVKVINGNRLVQDQIGKELALQTSAATRFLMRNDDGTATPITLADLQVGQNVSASGKAGSGAWIAERITVGVLVNHLP